MGFGEWLRRLFASVGPDDEAAEREEYGVRDRGKADLDRQRFSGHFAASEGAEAAKDELDSLDRPPDSNP